MLLFKSTRRSLRRNPHGFTKQQGWIITLNNHMHTVRHVTSRENMREYGVPYQQSFDYFHFCRTEPPWHLCLFVRAPVQEDVCGSESSVMHTSGRGTHTSLGGRLQDRRRNRVRFASTRTEVIHLVASLQTSDCNDSGFRAAWKYRAGPTYQSFEYTARSWAREWRRSVPTLALTVAEEPPH